VDRENTVWGSGSANTVFPWDHELLNEKRKDRDSKLYFSNTNFLSARRGKYKTSLARSTRRRVTLINLHAIMKEILLPRSQEGVPVIGHTLPFVSLLSPLVIRSTYQIDSCNTPLHECRWGSCRAGNCLDYPQPKHSNGH